MTGYTILTAETSSSAAPISRAMVDPQLLKSARSYLRELHSQSRPSRELARDFLRFYGACSALIARYARSCRVPPGEREDCAQNVWMELVEKLENFELDTARGQFSSWLFSLVHSEAVDGMRRRAVRFAERLHADIPARESEPFAADDPDSDGTLLRQLLEHLRDDGFEDDCRLLEMRWFHGYSVEQLAQELGMTHQQVWTHHHRAKLRLRSVLSRSAAIHA